MQGLGNVFSKSSWSGMNQDINTEKAAERMAVPRLRGEERSAGQAVGLPAAVLLRGPGPEPGALRAAATLAWLPPTPFLHVAGHSVVGTWVPRGRHHMGLR